MLVLALHYAVTTVKADFGSLFAYLIACFRLTWSGVDLFFVLSGFLIGGILIDNRDSYNYFKVFYARRTCRIFPLYYMNVLLFFLLLRLAGPTFSSWLFDKPLHAISYLTFTQNFTMARSGGPSALWLGPTWSLAVEEQFYLLLPLMIRFIPKGRLAAVLTAGILVAPALRVILYYSLPSGWFASAVLMPTRADALFLGVLLACLLRQRAAFELLQRKRAVLHLLFTILLLGMAVLTVWSPGADTKVMAFVGYTWIALFYALLVLLGLVYRKGLIGRAMRSKPLRDLGGISYGIYLIHVPMLGLCHAIFFGREPEISGFASAAVTAGALFLTWALAKLSFRLLEKPMINFGRRRGYQVNAPDSHSAKGCDPLFELIPNSHAGLN